MFPVCCERVGEVGGAVAVLRGPAAYLCVLTKCGVVVRELFDLSARVVSIFLRDEESVRKYGYNHWMTAVSGRFVAFGTCSGVCFVGRIGEDGKVSVGGVVEVGCAVTGVFRCHGAVGVCTSDSRIVIINERGEIVVEHRLPFDGMGMRVPRMYGQGMLAGVVKNQPCLMRVPAAAVERRKKLKPMFFNTPDAVMVAFCQRKEVLAVATVDGSVVCIQSQPVYVIKRDPKDAVSEVIFMDWIGNDSLLCIVKRNGSVYLHDYSTKTTSATTVAELCGAQSLYFDESIRCLMFTDGSGIWRLEFATMASEFAFTCARVFDYATRSFCCVCDGSMFPYQNVIKSPKGWVLQSRDYVAVRIDDKCVAKKIHTEHVAAVDDFVFLFVNQGGENHFIATDWQLEELGKRQLAHSVHNVTQNRNILVASCHTRLTCIAIGDENTEAHPEELVPGRLYVKLTEIASPHQIRAALCFGDVGPVVFGWDDTVTGLRNGKLSEHAVARVTWSSKQPEVLVLQKAQHIIVIYKQLVYRFPDIVCLFTDGCEAFRLKQEVTFGMLEFDTTSFAPFLILSQNLSNYDELVSLYKDKEIKQILASCIRLTSYKDQMENLMNLMNRIIETYSPPEAAAIIELAIEEIDECERVVFLGVPLPWSYFFGYLKDATKVFFFLFASPRLFDMMREEEFAVQYFASRDILVAFVDACLKTGRIVRAWRLATDSGIDITSQIKRMCGNSLQYLDKCIPLIEKEVNRWNLWDTFAPRSMATFFSNSEVRIISLATFIILQEAPKLEAILMVDEEMKKVAQKFVTTASFSRHRAFVQACMNSIQCK